MFSLSRSQARRIRSQLSCAIFFACSIASMGAAASQYISVEEHVDGKVGSALDVTAHCPDGFELTGGGFDMSPGARTITYYTYVTTPVKKFDQATAFAPRMVGTISRPNDAGDGWRVAGFANDDVTLYAWARCKSIG